MNDILHPNSYNLSGARSILVDRHGQPLTVDDDTLDMVIIEHEHYKTHEGDHYFIKAVQDVTGAGTLQYFSFVTPDTDTRIHARAKMTAESEFWLGIYEGGSVSAPGTQIHGLNNNRGSLNIAQLLAFDSPTVSDDGFLMWSDQTGTGGKPTGVAPEFGYEIVARRNTRYIFKAVKEAAGTHYMSFDFWWYEQDHASQFEGH